MISSIVLRLARWSFSFAHWLHDFIHRIAWPLVMRFGEVNAVVALINEQLHPAGLALVATHDPDAGLRGMIEADVRDRRFDN